MKLQIQLRTVSRNGQIAIPRRFLEALGVAPLAKVQVVQERKAIVIRPSPMTRMSDKAFQAFLSGVRSRNHRVTSKQVDETIRRVRRTA